MKGKYVSTGDLGPTTGGVQSWLFGVSRTNLEASRASEPTGEGNHVATSAACAQGQRVLAVVGTIKTVVMQK